MKWCYVFKKDTIVAFFTFTKSMQDYLLSFSGEDEDVDNC